MHATEDLLTCLPPGFPANESSVQAASLIAERCAALSRGDTPPLIGINGAQGSGKSTITRIVAEALRHFYGLRPVLLSLDDSYYGKPPRYQLADKVHPLCETRGVPGTHDVPLLLDTLDDLNHAGPDSRTSLPQFDKLDDDRIPREDWPEFVGKPDIILLEGWCVGLRAEDVPAWTAPMNELEAGEDPEGEWINWSLKCLRDEYTALWDRIGLLISIRVPDLDTVIESRLKQEEGLSQGDDRERMGRAAIIRFVQHYERFTRALWATMPNRADIVFRRNEDFDFNLLHG